MRGLKLIEESFKTVAHKMDFQVLEFNSKTDHVLSLIEDPHKLFINFGYFNKGLG